MALLRGDLRPQIGTQVQKGGDIMIRFLIAAFFVGHGLVHGIMFGLTYDSKAMADIPYNHGPN
jgi:hypothetical protein